MSGVVVRIDEGAVRQTMDAWAARLLAAHPQVEEIVVFGSFVNRQVLAPALCDDGAHLGILEIQVVLAGSESRWVPG